MKRYEFYITRKLVGSDSMGLQVSVAEIDRQESKAGRYVDYSDVAPLVEDSRLMAKWIVNHYKGTKDYGCRECVGDEAMSTEFRCGYHTALTTIDAQERGV